jgi:NADH-quinone oxidoreductase subunit F
VVTSATKGADWARLTDMTIVHRVLPPDPVTSLEEHVRRRGGRGLENARKLDADALIAEVTAAGLRGRGGAGFPTGVKWRTVLDNQSSVASTTVVVNGAEGEPGTFKDRTLLRMDPYNIVEGALIAALAVGAQEVIFGLKRSFVTEVARLERAIEEMNQAGWTEGISLQVFQGPNEYLYGEETALLETIDGRYPFPRIAPPFRRGVHDVATAADANARSGLSAHIDMAGPDGDGLAAPTLVDNIETLANVPHIIARGANWFRTDGTDESPGTIVCTVMGSTRRAGVGEILMGTPLREVIDLIGGGAREGHRIKAVLSGVSNGFIPADLLDAPVSYEGLAAIGSGLGSAGFMVFDDSDDLVAVTAGVSRFLAVESCGQCTPCKRDGLALSGLLSNLCHSEGSRTEVARLRSLVDTVADRARCYLASQHQVVVTSLLDRFPDEVDRHLSGAAAPADVALIAELVDIRGDEAVVDEHHLGKQPDWTYDLEDSGQFPADRLDDHHAAARALEE